MISKGRFQNAVATALMTLAASSVGVVGEDANSTCLTSLQEMFDSELNVKNVLVLRKYVLCPNTTFQVASEYDDDGNPANGDPPIIVGRPNVHVFCGEDGKSDNNCVLNGGLVHVGIYNEFKTNGPWATNTILSGLTFSDASDLNILADFQADVIIRDCIFTNNKNIANVRLQLTGVTEEQKQRNFPKMDELGRPWVGNPEYDGSVGLTVMIDSCSFERNTIGSNSKMHTGLIQVFAGNLTVHDTTFVENDIDAVGIDDVHYIIGNFGSDLVIRNSCFIQNNVSAAPVINQGGNFESEFVSGIYTNLYVERPLCGFAANVLEGSLKEMDDLFTDCEYYDADECMHIPFPDIPTPSPTPRLCWDSLTDIYLNEREVTDDSVLRTYILCSDTTYDVASEFDKSGLAQDGQQYLIIGRPNMRVQCGEGGGSENNCILTGGSLQLAVYDEFRTGVDATNVVVEGLTFTGASLVNIYSEFYGDIIIKDCIFEDNANLAAVLARPPALSENRKLIGDVTLDIERSIAELGAYKNLQPTSITIIMIDCIFKNNVVGLREGWTGLITSNDSNLEVKNTLFVSNTDAGAGTNAYIIGNFGGDMYLTGNCFIDNKIGASPVIHKGGSYSASYNSGDLNSGMPGLRCKFLADVVEETSFDTNVKFVDMSCIDYDSEQCSLMGSPTAAPSSSSVPTEGTTSEKEELQPVDQVPAPSPPRLPTVDIDEYFKPVNVPTTDHDASSSPNINVYSSAKSIVVSAKSIMASLMVGLLLR